MIFNILVLLVTTMLGGLSFYIFPQLSGKHLKLPLVFAGAYLFSLTIIHIIPELYESDQSVQLIGIFILLGFFGQFLLEYLTAGVEHGHMHKPHPGHHHSMASMYMLMIGLSIHSILEGTLLAHPHDHANGEHSTTALLLGIILHKMPAAFALMTIFTCEFKEKHMPIILLFLFSIMSPLGVFLGDYLQHLSQDGIVILFAFVSGNFLHISTTIFFESSPEHKWSFPKLMVIVLGMLLAIATESAMH